MPRFNTPPAGGKSSSTSLRLLRGPRRSGLNEAFLLTIARCAAKVLSL